MSELISIFFGPLNKPACGYFLLLSILFFIALLVLLFVQISYIIQNYKKLPFKMILFSAVPLFHVFLGYYVSRLLHTMCTKSLV
jgi:uncharacterized metal-binding protein